jgi:hypothetical protein
VALKGNDSIGILWAGIGVIDRFDDSDVDDDMVSHDAELNLVPVPDLLALSLLSHSVSPTTLARRFCRSPGMLAKIRINLHLHSFDVYSIKSGMVEGSTVSGTLRFELALDRVSFK